MSKRLELPLSLTTAGPARPLLRDVVLIGFRGLSKKPTLHVSGAQGVKVGQLCRWCGSGPRMCCSNCSAGRVVGLTFSPQR